MSKFIKTFLLLLISHPLIAQKYDYVWVFGYYSQVEDTLFGGSFIDFKENPPKVFRGEIPFNFKITDISISDPLGNLQFYSNAIQIANNEGEIIQNGTGLNPGPVASDNENNGYILDQGAIFLPNPTLNTQYYIIHANREYPNDIIRQSHTKKLYYTLVDRSFGYEKGRVILKNKEIINDFLEPGKITATKHANGRDWWIITKRFETNEYYCVLVTSTGINVLEPQALGSHYPAPGIGQAIFSPDGTKYARINIIDFFDKENYLNIYDFDRCSGELSNPIQFQLRDSISSGGVAISPNNRFLYVSAARFIFQYDLWEDDIESTKDTVAIYDGFQAPFPTLFYHCQLAPNGKIYINTSNGSNILHIIHQPNQKGEACMVEQHGLTLPTYNAFSLPNFPNYRLGPLQGSPCDTLGLTHTTLPPTKRAQFLVYPNPSTNFLYLKWKDESTFLKEVFSWRLLDALGREVKRLNFTNNFIGQKVNVADLADGVYFWELRSPNGVIDKGKVVKWNRK